MLSFDVSMSKTLLLFDSAFPRTAFGTDTQQTDEQGTPLWLVNVLVRQADARRSETMTVIVPSATNPEDEIRPFAPVSFDGLTVRTGESGNGRWVSVRAERVVARQTGK